MAHPCIQCASECYCNGDIDDAIVSKTPKRCEGCGCEEFADEQGWNDDDDYEDGNMEPDEWRCIGCGYRQRTGGQCQRCMGWSMDEVYY